MVMVMVRVVLGSAPSETAPVPRFIGTLPVAVKSASIVTGSLLALTKLVLLSSVPQ
jgi:hypothetical protein